MPDNNDMPSKRMSSTLFTAKAPQAKKPEQSYEDMLSIFQDFYLAKYKDQYILQFGLINSFVPVDNPAEDLSDYCKAIFPIKLMLEQLKIIPANSDYFIFGHNAAHPVIDENASNFLLECNMKAGNYLAIKLPTAPAAELADRLKRIGLSERSNQYTIFIEGETASAPTPNTSSKPTLRGR